MKKEGKLKQTLSNNFYIMKLSWRLSPGRVAGCVIFTLLDRFEYLYFAGFFLKKVLSFAENGGSYESILSFILFTAVLFFAVQLFQTWYQNVLKPRTDVKVYQGLYKLLYEKACSVELSCFEDSDFYDRYMLAMTDSDKRLLSTVDNICTILAQTAAVTAACYMMAQIDPFLILFVSAPLIGNFFFSERANRLVWRIYEESAIFRRVADYVNRVAYLADYAKELRTTNMFRVMQKKQQDAIKGMTDVMDRHAGKNILFGWGYLYFTFTVLFEGILFYGAYRTIVSGTMRLSDFTILTTLMTSVAWTLISYTEAVISCFRNSLFIQKLRDFLSYEPVIPEDGDGVLPDPVIREIAFHNVSFCYKKGKPVLKNISFCLHGTETCALAGYNGAGKTTLIKLLLRLYDPTEGEITLNGTDIRKYDVRAYRALFATAFQDGKIFARSIRDNIWMGKPCSDPFDAALKEALSLADILAVAQGLPHGADTVLTREFSEEGAVLSGGQYQKIVAARAFSQTDAPIQVFDEPSSALDPIAEHALMESIKKAGAGKLQLLISHRLSALQDVDRIILLKNGRIAEQGTHDSLLASGGEYAALYHMQASKYNLSAHVDCPEPDAAL